MAKQQVLSLMVAVTLTGCAMPASPTSPGTLATSQGAENALMAPSDGRAIRPEAPAASMAPGAKAAPGAAMDAAESLAAPMAPEAGGAIAPRADEFQQQDALKAGAVDDNAKFSDFLKYVAGYQGYGMRALDVRRRFVVQVVDAEGKSVSNASVAVSAGETPVATLTTYANGETLFHPGAFGEAAQAQSFSVRVTKGEQTVTQAFQGDAEGVWELKLPGAVVKPAAKLDVLFLLDATGSMGGEIDRLQSTIKTMASRIQGLPHQPSVRFGLVAYRDQNEEYVTRKTDFTADVTAFQAALDLVRAEGGGDKPEDVEAAISAGVSGMSWAEGDAVRLAFLVADAAPHVDYPQSTPYTTSVKRAAEKGVKLYPIGCSGLEPEGEYAFRQMAQYTMGQYLFITRGGDESSGGGGAASATVDKFQEGRLDDIVVDIVKAELDSLGK